MPLEKNQIIPLTITGTTAEGSGIGRVQSDDESNGMAVFVPFTAIGDKIDCHILKVSSTHAFGRVDYLVTPSPDRLADPDGQDCSVFGRCGGCTWRHVRYDAELRYKQQRVADAIQRIGGFDIDIQPIVGCDDPDGYRNKAQYPVAPGPYRPLVGFYAARSHRVVEQHDCKLQPPIFKTIVDSVTYWAKKNNVSAYDEQAKTGLLRHIYIRQAQATGEVMVCLVCTSGKLPATDKLIAALREVVPTLVSVMINVNKEDTNVILGSNEFVLWGQSTITDELCGLRFRLSPRSFYQVNRQQAERLYSLAAEAADLKPDDVLLDVYCGTGTIGLSMASRVREVIGIEIVESAVEDARRNAEENGIINARFLCADAPEAAVTLQKEGVRPDAVVLDPPRKGCDAALIDTIVHLAPSRIVYVSCDPATLARDLKHFAEQGYTLRHVTPVDMFPRTSHVETCVLLSHKNS